MLKIFLLKTRTFRYWLDRVSFPKRAARDIRALQGTYSGRPLLIVGNGPSLNQTPLDEFSSIPAFGMNKIDLIYPKVSWRPNLVFCNNNLVAKQNWRRWLQEGVPVLLSWKCRWFVPFWKWHKFCFYLNDANTDFSDDPSVRVGSAGTVSYAVLQFAVFVRANPIIIVGIDHNFTGVKQSDAHNIEKREGDDENHFDPNYFAHGQLWGIPNLDLSEVGFANIRDSAEARGVKVLDATVGGKLDIFEKISVDQAVDIVKAERN